MSFYFDTFTAKGSSAGLATISMNNDGNYFTTCDSVSRTFWLYNKTQTWTNVFTSTLTQATNLTTAISGNGAIAAYAYTTLAASYVFFTNSNAPMFQYTLPLEASTISLNQTGNLLLTNGNTNYVYNINLQLSSVINYTSYQPAAPLGLVTRNSQFIVYGPNVTVFSNSAPTNNTPSYTNRAALANLSANSFDISEDATYLVTASTTTTFYKWSGTSYLQYSQFAGPSNFGTSVAMSRDGNYAFIGFPPSSIITFKNTGTSFISTNILLSTPTSAWGFGYSLATNWNATRLITSDNAGNTFILNRNVDPINASLRGGSSTCMTYFDNQSISMSKCGTVVLTANTASIQNTTNYAILSIFKNSSWNTVDLTQKFGFNTDGFKNNSTVNQVCVSGDGNAVSIIAGNGFSTVNPMCNVIKVIRNTDGWTNLASPTTSTYTVVLTNTSFAKAAALNYNGNILATSYSIGQDTRTFTSRSTLMLDIYYYTSNYSRIQSFTVLSSATIAQAQMISMSKNAQYPNGNFLCISDNVHSTAWVYSNTSVIPKYSLRSQFRLLSNFGHANAISDDGQYAAFAPGSNTTLSFNSNAIYYYDSVKGGYFSTIQTRTTKIYGSSKFFANSMCFNSNGSVLGLTSPFVTNAIYTYNRIGSNENAFYTIFNSNYVNGATVTDLFGLGLAMDDTGGIYASVWSRSTVTTGSPSTIFLNNSLCYSNVPYVAPNRTFRAATMNQLTSNAFHYSYTVSSVIDKQFFMIKDKRIVMQSVYSTFQINFASSSYSNIDNRNTSILLTKAFGSLSFINNNATNSAYLLHAGTFYRDPTIFAISTHITPYVFISTGFVGINALPSEPKFLEIPSTIQTGAFYILKNITSNTGGFYIRSPDILIENTGISGCNFFFNSPYAAVILSYTSNAASSNIFIQSASDFGFLTAHPTIQPSSYNPSTFGANLLAGVNLIDSTTFSRTVNLPRDINDGSLIIVKDIGGNCLNNVITIQDPRGYLTIDGYLSAITLTRPYGAVWLIYNSPNYWLVNYLK